MPCSWSPDPYPVLPLSISTTELECIMEAQNLQPMAVSYRALRLVNTKDMEREEWLNIRKRGIGGSDAAAAVRLTPYKTQRDIWMGKTGRDKELPKPDPTDGSPPIFWGTALEPIVAVQYAKKTGNKVRRINAVL